MKGVTFCLSLHQWCLESRWLAIFDLDTASQIRHLFFRQLQEHNIHWTQGCTDSTACTYSWASVVSELRHLCSVFPNSLGTETWKLSALRNSCGIAAVPVKIFSWAESFKYKPALLLLRVGERSWNSRPGTGVTWKDFRFSASLCLACASC